MELKLTKIKKHSNDLYNDKADKFAKKALLDSISYRYLVIRLDKLNYTGEGINYRMQWNGINIDTRTRSFIKGVKNNKYAID